MNRRKDELIAILSELYNTSYLAQLPAEIACIVKKYLFSEGEYYLVADGKYDYCIQGKIQTHKYYNKILYETYAFDDYDFIHQMHKYIYICPIINGMMICEISIISIGILRVHI
jgi:hypothetical protein